MTVPELLLLQTKLAFSDRHQPPARYDSYSPASHPIQAGKRVGILVDHPQQRLVPHR